jgi:hypothetical protein
VATRAQHYYQTTRPASNKAHHPTTLPFKFGTEIKVDAFRDRNPSKNNLEVSRAFLFAALCVLRILGVVF